LGPTVALLLDHAGKITGGHVGQLFRFHFMEAAAVHPAFSDEVLTGQRLTPKSVAENSVTMVRMSEGSGIHENDA
jgi:hypothetical protein